MSLGQILVFIVFALLVGFIPSQRLRTGLLLVSSLLAVFWLQPSTPIRNLDFWLPALSIGLTVLVWFITQPGARQDRRSVLGGAAIILGVILVSGLTRYLGPLCCLTPSRPPELIRVAMALGLWSLVIGGVAVAIPARSLFFRRVLPGLAVLLLLALFIILKASPLAAAASAGLRTLAGQSTALSSSLDLRWLGFSYLAFRLLHVLRDAQSGRLPAFTLSEFVTYALFFPTYTSGPIDRVQRFLPELRTAAASSPESSNLNRGLLRILVGVFKKFVLADSLALFALSPDNALQVHSAVWMWVLLYAYTLRLYFDFSGYTDIALGLGNLLGFRLPENFDRPYLRTNLTTFWNSWHITLAHWFRAYFFNPLTRALRSGARKWPTWIVILIGQLLTMLLIGLWHGITPNFAAWGAWHGLGLFLHSRWSEWVRQNKITLAARPRLEPFLRFAGWFLTFHYVTLGWVLFALPTIDMASQVFRKLFGA